MTHWLFCLILKLCQISELLNLFEISVIKNLCINWFCDHTHIYDIKKGEMIVFVSQSNAPKKNGYVTILVTCPYISGYFERWSMESTPLNQSRKVGKYSLGSYKHFRFSWTSYLGQSQLGSRRREQKFVKWKELFELSLHCLIQKKLTSTTLYTSTSLTLGRTKSEESTTLIET